VSDNKRRPDQEPPKAQHGPRSEVVWKGGTGRQPYGNQDAEQPADPSAAPEVPEGNRGEASGRNLEQSNKSKGKP